MKNLILLFVTVLSTTAMAQSGEIVVDSMAGRVSATARLCPIGMTCIVDGTVATIEYGVSCATQELKPVSYTDSKSGTVYVHLQTAHIKRGESEIVCLGFRMERFSVTMINHFGPFKVVYLGTNQVENHPGHVDGVAL